MADALHYQICTALQGIVQTLVGGELPPEQVYLRKLPIDRDVVLPAILVGPLDRERMDPGDFNDLVRRYPVVVVFVAANNQDFTLQEPELKWRELVLDWLDRNNALPGVPEVWNRTIEPQAVLDLTLWKDANLFGGAILVWFWILKPR